jgi:hypothetical protein
VKELYIKACKQNTDRDLQRLTDVEAEIAKPKKFSQT